MIGLTGMEHLQYYSSKVPTTDRILFYYLDLQAFQTSIPVVCTQWLMICYFNILLANCMCLVYKMVAEVKGHGTIQWNFIASYCSI